MRPEHTAVKALVFDVFSTVVDWIAIAFRRVNIDFSFDEIAGSLTLNGKTLPL